MKRFLFIGCIAIAAVTGCNDQPKETAATTTATDSITPVAPALNYPYDIGRPYADWQPGNKQHALSVMTALKAYENGDIANSLTYFGDSVEVRFDYFSAKLSNDSLKKMFTKQRGDYSKITVHMGDWESVISADKKEEYVTLWYKEVFTDKKGKTDSLSVVDDAKIVNGKIVKLDEKIQHFPAKK